MAKKFYVEIISHCLMLVAATVCSLYLKAIGEKLNAFLLFLFVVYFFILISRKINGWYHYWELCRELKSIGDDVPQKALKICSMKRVSLWVRYASQKEIKRFSSYFFEMSEKDAGYAEVKCIIEQFYNQ